MNEIIRANANTAIEKATRRRPGEAFLDRFVNKSTKKTMRASLRAVMEAIARIIVSEGSSADFALSLGPEDFPWEQITYDVAQKIRNDLVTRYKPRTTQTHLGALAGVLKVAVRLKLFDAASLEEMKDRGGPLHRSGLGRTIPAGRMLEPDEVMTLIEGKHRVGTWADRRDRAILALAAFTGMRRAEIASLDVASIDFETHKLRVIGKGDKEREIAVPDGAISRVESYISECGILAGPLFPNARRGGHLVRGTRITPNGVADLIGRACKVLATPATTHDFRRTFASTLIDEGVDLPTVADLMGHENIETTRSYDRRGDERKKVAASILDSVFTRKPPEPR